MQKLESARQEALSSVQSGLNVVSLPGITSEYFRSDGEINLDRLAKALHSVPGLLAEGSPKDESLFTRMTEGDRIYAHVNKFESDHGPAVVKFVILTNLGLDDVSASIEGDRDMLALNREKGLGVLCDNLHVLEVEGRCLGVINKFENIKRTLLDVVKGGSPEELSEARPQVESIVKTFNGFGYYLWDNQASNFVQLECGTWKLIDAGSFSKGAKAAQNYMFEDMFVKSKIEW